MYACVMNGEMTLCNMSPSLLSMHFLLRSEVQQRHLCPMPLLVDTVIGHLTAPYCCWCVLWLLSLCAHILISVTSLDMKIILRLMYILFATLWYCKHIRATHIQWGEAWGTLRICQSVSIVNLFVGFVFLSILQFPYSKSWNILVSESIKRSSYCLRSFDINRDWKSTVWLVRKKSLNSVLIGK